MEASLCIPKFQDDKLSRWGTASILCCTETYVFLEAESFHLL